MSKQSLYLADLPTLVKEMEAMRKDDKNPRDITLAEYVKLKYPEITMETFYEDLGVNPNIMTIENLLNMPDQNIRWLIPEIYREALRLGIRKAPIYPSLIAGEQSISGLELNMPAINMSDAGMKKVGVGETIPLGDVSFDQKKVKIYKLGRGIKIPYEVRQYVAINLVALYMQDMGIKMGMGLDYLALTTAINGDQADGTDAAPVLGVATDETLVYRDILKLWFRLSRLGRTPTIQIAGEDTGLDVMELYLNTRFTEGKQRTQVNPRVTLPNAVDLYIHGAIPDKQILMIDKAGALLKLNAQPLLVETEKIVSNQTEGTYATITTGFATIFKDARIILDKGHASSEDGYGLEDYDFLNPAPFEVVPFGKKG